MGRVAAYRDLVQRLKAARRTYDSESEREGLRMALRAVAQYLSDAEVDPDLKMMFLNLQLALGELGDGVTADVLRPAEVTHRPRQPMAKFLAKAYASAIMELFMRGRESKKAAANQTARAVKHWLNFKDVDVTATTVMHWRDSVKEKRASESRDKKLFDMLVDLGLQADEDPKKGARVLIEEAIHFGPRKRKI